MGTALPNLDLFSVNVVLPAIAAQFPGVALHDLSWVVNAYAIAYAALLVFFGCLAESCRREHAFILGIGLFAAAAAASAAATQFWALVAFRVIAAAGAALMTPTSISLLLGTFPPAQRSAMVQHWAGIGGLAAALGPLLGGALSTLGWRWIFIANAAIAATAMLAAWRVLPAVPGHAMPRPGFAAAGCLSGGIAALILTIVQGHAWGWQSARIATSSACAVLALAVFAMHCRRAANPLIDPALFRIRAFAGAVLAMVPYSVSFGAMLFSVAIWGQTAWGWSALHAGLAMIAGPLLVPITSTWLTGRLIARCGALGTVALGVALFVACLLLWAFFVGTQPDTALMVLGMALNGVGVGLIFPTLMGLGTQALPPSAFSTGSAVINMLRQAAIAVGVAIFVAIVATPAGTALSAQQRLAAFQFGWQIMAAITLLTLLPACWLLRPRAQDAA